MPLQQYVVKYLSGSTYTALTNIEAINVNIGVQAQLDQIKASTATCVIRYSTGYATPITQLKSGTDVIIENNTVPASAYTVWEGKIADVSVQYGMPYVGGVGNADYATITMEGFFAELGRMDAGNYAMAAGTLDAQMNTATTQSGVPMAYISGGEARTGAATTVSSTWGDWVARTALTNNARLRDGAEMTTGKVNIISPFSIVPFDYNFSDAPTGSDQKYDVINFDSLSDNYYNQVTVSTESFGSVTVLEPGVFKPYRTYEVNTINASASQATDYANYLLNNYKTPKLAISSISASAEQQGTFKLDTMVSIFSLYYYPGCSVNITFRGTTYPCVIEGVSMNATPESTRFTFYVSGVDLNPYLILNSATFGKLDTNRLGY
jgi:hypothetical protein